MNDLKKELQQTIAQHWIELDRQIEVANQNLVKLVRETLRHHPNTTKITIDAAFCRRVHVSFTRYKDYLQNTLGDQIVTYYGQPQFVIEIDLKALLQAD